MAGHPPAARPTSGCASWPKTLAEAPSLLALDRKDRSDFLRLFYRRYDGAPVDQIDEDAAEMFWQLILAKSFPAAIRRVREHRRLGHRTVLITGALDFVVEPLRAAVRRHRVRRARRRAANGAYTGELHDVPPTGETRAQALMDYAAATTSTCASPSPTPTPPATCPMLEVVGFPVAVNPETRLAALARKRGLAGRALDQGRRRAPAARADRRPAPTQGRPGQPARAGDGRRVKAA